MAFAEASAQTPCTPPPLDSDVPAPTQLHDCRLPTTHNIEQNEATAVVPPAELPMGRQPPAQAEAPPSGSRVQWVPNGSPVLGVSVHWLEPRSHLRPVGQSLSCEQIG